jgi:hypothetical protein
MASDTEHDGTGEEGKEQDIIGSLMGNTKRSKPVSIEEIEDS